ncbi:ATP-binding protein [Pseudomonas sp. GM60]|jgi:signal transduction histidine kinase|uniref:ATP-binding protein n=1 Tax=Pseudomonas sp. GM60 TaxID=1144334 RepID=UPI0002705D50|nr:ATP-binding protein [Pseudomonas sp. GM60]EJM86842.1 histidine kinase [Pseudomonas sp. GM60]
MIEAISFKTRARTIDHLGREQIADCPTAISELWKNAYDAYAKNVALHIYQGPTPICSLIDDGHGMNRKEFIEKWLVVGTDSKASGDQTKEEDRNGLNPRPRQGQKGIGRLSAAALGPLLLFVSKRRNSPFVVALIDWRLFENPYLLLDDVEIPIIESTNKEDILKELPNLFTSLLGNISGSGENIDRDERIIQAWARYEEVEKSFNKESTRSLIESAIISSAFSDENFSQWPVWNNTSDHGTALLVSDISFDLLAQLNTLASSSQEQAEQQARERLRETLSNFTDPFFSEDDVKSGYAISDFDYKVMTWHGQLPTQIISENKSFDYNNLEDLEHVLEGEFDEFGVFRGAAKVFGKWQDEPIIIVPKSIGAVRSDTRVGPFRLRIGTFEQTLENTSHPKEVWSKLLEQSAKHGGFMVYRDGLRVMPYGREDNDFFEIEKRRSNHAGREFWSYRRLFGRVAIARAHNPNLKDKAGREGIIDNKAAKVFRDLVENLLMTSARRYFGTDSKIRKLVLPEIQSNNKQIKAEAAQKNVRARQRKEFKSKLEAFTPKVVSLCNELESIALSAQGQELPTNEEDLLRLRERLLELQATRGELTFGSIPTTLGSMAEGYKTFRKMAVRANDLISQLNSTVLFSLEKVRPKSPRDIAYSELSRHANSLQQRLKRWGTEARNLLAAETERLISLVDERNKLYHAASLPFLESLETEENSLTKTLNILASERDRLDQENEELFSAYISTLRSLKESIDIDAMVSFSLERYESAINEITRLNSLAQLGITVEIIGHEIEGLESTISDALRESSNDFKKTKQYNAINHAHSELSDRLRFLSPLKLSGEKVREWISGSDIFEYTKNFLSKSLDSCDIKFTATQEFEKFSIFEQPQRIYPVFINLINNSIYWIANRERPEILLDVIDNEIVVSDNGPGIDADDIEKLFTLFFTTKVRGGRGVGLYLCRANLAAGGHTIAYSNTPTKSRLSGANFLINFKGAKHA